ncbi:hypothetical protein CPC08DRAFT_716518 [Agrocybe pediades]|nr:hypothetical protein CPC08DRAFT_716518 [Agrocybe pediades]
MFIETKIAIRYLAWTLIPALLLFPSVFGWSNTPNDPQLSSNHQLRNFISQRTADQETVYHFG